jgi:hypothetical protein
MFPFLRKKQITAVFIFLIATMGNVLSQVTGHCDSGVISISILTPSRRGGFVKTKLRDTHDWNFEQLLKYYKDKQSSAAVSHNTTATAWTNEVQPGKFVTGVVSINGDPCVLLFVISSVVCVFQELILLEPADRDTKPEFVIVDLFSGEPRTQDDWFRVELITSNVSGYNKFYNHFTVLYVNKQTHRLIEIHDPSLLHDIRNRQSENEVTRAHLNIGYLIIDILNKHNLTTGVVADPVIVDDLAIAHIDVKDSEHNYINITLFDKKANALSTYVVHKLHAMDPKSLHDYSQQVCALLLYHIKATVNVGWMRDFDRPYMIDRTRKRREDS